MVEPPGQGEEGGVGEVRKKNGIENVFLFCFVLFVCFFLFCFVFLGGGGGGGGTVGKGRTLAEFKWHINKLRAISKQELYKKVGDSIWRAVN